MIFVFIAKEMRERRSASFCINDEFITTRLSSLRAAHNVASKKIWQKYCMQWQISKKQRKNMTEKKTQVNIHEHRAH